MRPTAVLALLLLPAAAVACSFCADGVTGRQPLSTHFTGANVVVFGTLKNPKPGADGLTGSTDLVVETVLKAPDAFAKTSLVTIPRYVPVIGDTPPAYLLFCTVADGKLDPVHGTPASKPVADYVKQVAALDRKNPAAALGFFFRHLDSAEAMVSADAFVEFARASDKEIAAAAAGLDRAKIRRWLTDPTTPDERVGVYAMMLGLCGAKEDAAFIAGLLRTNPLPDRLAANVGGLLAGLTLLDADTGWAMTTRVVTSDRPFTERLSAIGTVRYFQATRETASRAKILDCYRQLLTAGEFADLAADDLRRWQWWDATADVLAGFDKPTHKAAAVRRGIVRYALSCPDESAKAFVAAVRTKDAALVKKVEDGLKLYK